MLESIAHIPQFTMPNSSMAHQAHLNLQRYITTNMDFAQNFASSGGSIGLVAKSHGSSTTTVPPPPTTQSTKSAARRARKKEREEANVQARINAAMASVTLPQHPPFPPPPYPGLPPLTNNTLQCQRFINALHHNNSSARHLPDSPICHLLNPGTCGGIVTFTSTHVP